MTEHAYGKLNEVIKSDIESISALPLGAKERSEAISNLEKLSSISNAYQTTNEKIIENRDRNYMAEAEADLKKRELEDKQKSDRTKNILTIIGIAVPTIVAFASMFFELDGHSFTTLTGKNSINRATKF